MRSALTSTGSRLTRSSRVKLKCLNLSDNQNYWDSFWGANWSQSDVTNMLSAAVAAGFNCVKVYFDGMTSGPYGGNGYQYGSGYPTQAVLQPRVAWFVQQCRALGLRIYLGMNQYADFAASTTAATAANIASEMTFLSFFAQIASDILVAVDLCNEMNSGGRGNIWGLVTTYGVTPTAAAIRDMTSLVQAARAIVPGVPLTASVYIGSASGVKNSFVTNGWLDLQYTLGLDYHDFHPYFDFDVDGLKPALADVTNLESRAKFIGRHLIGEWGLGMDSALPSPVGSFATACGGVGDCCVSQNSFGSNYFSVRGYYEGYAQASSTLPSDGYGYGLLNTSLASPRADIVTAVSHWPALT